MKYYILTINEIKENIIKNGKLITINNNENLKTHKQKQNKQ